MTAPVRIRVASLHDAEAITAIYAHHVRHGTATFEIDPPDAGEMRSRMQGVAAGGHPWLVAERQRQVVGYAYASPYRLRPAYRFTVEDSIYIAPEATRQRIGARLLEALVESAVACGYRQMIAVIGDTANAASIGVHRAAGFVELGVLRDVGRKFDRWIDVVLMQRALGEGARTPPAVPA